VGFTRAEQIRYGALRTVPELFAALRHDLSAMHGYLLVARAAIDCPSIWAVISSTPSVQAAADSEPALTRHYNLCVNCVEMLLNLIRSAISAAHDSALPEAFPCS
jgi:hypothetical protein